MGSKLILRLFALGVISCNCPVNAQNPIVQNVFTADPAVLVYHDTLFLYSGHDEDSATTRAFVMNDYLCFSTTDMVNWTQHGPVFSTASLGWAAKENANAAQVVFRDKKFFYYISPWSDLSDKGDCIAVGIANTPYGPFKDALGKPLIQPGQTNYSGHLWEDLDPTVLIDDDDQAYLYWGNNALYAVKLNKDMISYTGDIITFDIKDKTAFGPDYEEAPWIFKRNGLYYLMYAAFVPEHIYYSTSISPLGPWKYGGVVMDANAQGSIGNHPAAIQFNGMWYFFYMNQDLPNGHDKRRAVNVIPFDFNDDGSINKLSHLKSGITKPLKNLNPFHRTEAETIAWEQGIETAKDSTASNGICVTGISDGDYIKVRSVDFRQGASHFESTVSGAKNARGKIEIYLDSIDGKMVGTCKINATRDRRKWNKQHCTIKKITGVHDVFFVFKTTNRLSFDFDSWIFKE